MRWFNMFEPWVCNQTANDESLRIRTDTKKGRLITPY